MQFLVFIFKRRFRQSALNNFLSVRKIKNVYIFNFSGPILHYVGKFLYFFLRSKKIIFISCDGLDYLYRDTNSINLWMGGTTYKIPGNFKKFKNNFVSASSLFTNESKLLTFFPTNIHSSKINKEYKFIYISENKKVENKVSLAIWKENKDKFLEDLSLIDNVEFWKKIVDINDEGGQRLYVDIKSLLRFELVRILTVNLKNKLILVGSNWKKHYSNALESNYSDKFSENLYRGNICIDFGSKNSEMSIYPRTCKIIESGGLLFQSINKDSKIVFKDLIDITCFISLKDMEDKISFFLKNSNQLDELLIAQQKNFEKDDLNYKTLKKIENFFNKT